MGTLVSLLRTLPSRLRRENALVTLHPQPSCSTNVRTHTAVRDMNGPKPIHSTQPTRAHHLTSSSLALATVIVTRAWLFDPPRLVPALERRRAAPPTVATAFDAAREIVNADMLVVLNLVRVCRGV